MSAPFEKFYVLRNDGRPDCRSFTVIFSGDVSADGMELRQWIEDAICEKLDRERAPERKQP